MSVILFLFAASATEPALQRRELTDKERAEQIMREFSKELDLRFVSKSYDGVWNAHYRSPPRATHRGGVCAADEVKIIYDPNPSTATAIRKITSNTVYHLLTDEEDEERENPRWDISGEALEVRCANLEDGDSFFFDAQKPFDAIASFHALTKVKNELAKKKSRLVSFDCFRMRSAGTKKCPTDGFEIDPAEPDFVRKSNFDPKCDDDYMTCYRFSAGSSYCSHHWIGHVRIFWDTRGKATRSYYPESFILKSVQMQATPANAHDCFWDQAADQM